MKWRYREEYSNIKISIMPKKIEPDTPIEQPTPGKQPEIQQPVEPEQPEIPEEDPDIIPDESPYEPPPAEIPPSEL